MQVREFAWGRLAYWERGDGPPLLFIHGVGTPGELWFRDLEPLADARRLIVYDRRGYGQSSASPRDWRRHAEDAGALVDALGLERAAIVGYSGGAAIALDLVLARPQLASSVVLVDPAFDVKRTVTFGFVKTVAIAKLLARVRGERRGAEHWIRYVGSYRTGGSAFDKASPERRETLLANATGIFADAASGSAGEHLDTARLARIAAPVTIVEAALSPSFLRRSCARLRQLMPQARVVTLERAGHHITIDARDELLAILREATTLLPDDAQPVSPRAG